MLLAMPMLTTLLLTTPGLLRCLVQVRGDLGVKRSYEVLMGNVRKVLTLIMP